MNNKRVKVNDGYQASNLNEGYQPFLQHGYQPKASNGNTIKRGTNIIQPLENKEK